MCLENIKEVIEYTDWKMFREQKDELLKITHKQENNLLQGMINFIDALQDAIVQDGLGDEDEIFQFPKGLKITEREILIIPYSEDEQCIADLYDKINIIKSLCVVENVSGAATFQGNDIVSLTFTTAGDHWTIKGYYDKKKEEMPCEVIFPSKGIKYTMNWHPYDSMGGLDQQRFRQSITEILDDAYGN